MMKEGSDERWKDDRSDRSLMNGRLMNWDNMSAIAEDWSVQIVSVDFA